jgi:hypothetical protein
MTDPGPHAERYLLEAEALRRRQLLAGLLHGSRRTWRERQRLWPGLVAGVVVVAVIVAAIAVLGALRRQQGSDPRNAGLSASLTVIDGR